MKPSIPLSSYLDPEIFKREKVILFQNTWNFAGFTTDLENHNDYICTSIGSKSITIQNFHGELRAFHNVCSHRFSQIRDRDSGNGLLKCPYHGWVYDKNGIPVGIPHQCELENLNPTMRESLSMEQWLIETCGNFIFVKRYNNRISLKQFLQGAYDQLQKISEAIGEKIDRYETLIKANYKIVIENTLEGSHVDMVHQNTFGRGGTYKYEFLLADDPHLKYSAKSSKLDFKWQKLESLFNTRNLKLDRYYYQLIFPNLTLITPFGILFGIQSIQPVNVQETKLVSYLFLSKLNNSDLSASNKEMMKILSKSFKEMMNTVFEEDKVICEQVQLGISSLEDEDKSGIFTNAEKCVDAFHKAYNRFMQDSIS